MSRAARVVGIALGALLPLPGACSALAPPFLIGTVPSLFSDSTETESYAPAGVATWAFGRCDDGGRADGR